MLILTSLANIMQSVIQFLYPSSPLNSKHPDETYADEFQVMRSQFPTTLFSLESFLAGQFRTSLQALPTLYRGWMLTPSDYQHLYDAVTKAGATMLTSPNDYEYCHYLPRWYEALKDVTPETLFFAEGDDSENELKKRGWTSCFIKDYVKSLSTNGGSIVTDLATIPNVIAKMKKYRGQIEGGSCVRRLEPFLPETERRYFVFQGRAFSSDGEIPDVVQKVVERISKTFFSVDVIQRSDGVLRIVELGDGQVSDLKHWTPETFIKIFTG
jgi:ATP-grasp domain, R2K clade family 3